MAAAGDTGSEKREKQSPRKGRPSDGDDDEVILRELCTINGVNYDKLQLGGGMKVKKLEIFFFGFPRVVGMHHFPNLSVLCVMNQKIGKISGLQSCVNLKELWICEGAIEKIEGLKQCVNLVQLYLYTNRISQIEGLTTLVKLEVLWLNGNRIPSIEGMDTLTKLRDLNLGGNQITTIGTSLERFTDLEILNLSGNKIALFKDLVHLRSLPKLHSLSFCDPLYHPNPVCRLCNYSTHTLYHLPHLQLLDGKDVSSPELHRLIQRLVSKKKQFYRMKIHHTQQLAVQQCHPLKQRLTVTTEATYSRMRALYRQLKTLQCSPELLGQEEGREKSEALTQRVAVLSDHLQHMEQKCSEAVSSVERDIEDQCEHWVAELESGGNVKFTAGDPSLPWYKSCSDLTISRFSVADVEELGISGIQVEGVVRVENRLLHHRFNDRLREVLERETFNVTVQQISYKQLLDYLFLIWTPDLDVNAVCLNGCTVSGDKEGFVLMTNSVNLADAPRLIEAGVVKGGGGRLGRAWRGKLLLCKVFLGQIAETRSNKNPTCKDFPSVDSVYRQQSPHTANNMDSLQREWFVFEHQLVLPEYIIHFQYSSALLSSNPLDHMMSCEPAVGADQPTDEELLSLQPQLPTRPRLAMLDEATVLRITSASSLNSVQKLCLHDNHLARFHLASSLRQLTKLLLSFNELTSAEDIQHLPNLEVLDLSFNKLTTLEGMKSLPKLQQLDFSWNEVSNYHDSIAVLHKHTPSLESLDARYNPWVKQELFCTYTLGRLKMLRELNGRSVTPEESSLALRQVVTSHLSLSTLLPHTRTNTHPPHSLSLQPVAHTLHKESRHRPMQLSNSSNDWCTKVTSVSVRGLGLQKLSCLDNLSNLRWLSLADNTFTSIDGLSLCTKLEELTLDHNLLHTLDPPLHHLPALQWLSASHNMLTTLPSTAFTTLTKLEYLNVSNNSLRSLEGMQHLSALTELYASSNLISTARELFHLKPLPHLAVLDLSQNPLTTLCENYRAFAVYHLAPLKSLDSLPIDAGELAMSREKLGGRLTQDLIYERHPDIDVSSLRKLDLPNCGLKHVDLSPIDSFRNLASLNLEHNSLTSFSGLIYLNKLKVLCLNHNRVESLLPGRDALPPKTQVLHSLQVLHLASHSKDGIWAQDHMFLCYNGIGSLVPLQLGRIPSLRALFLQGNELTRVEGLEGLRDLTELVLDRNKLKSLQEDSLSSLYKLRELHLEENRLRDLSHFSPLPSLERLYLGMNRVQEFSELDKLFSLTQLIEFSIISNPVSRRLQHRLLLIYNFHSLLSLDGVTVSAEEREAANISFSRQQEPEAPEAVLPGLANAAALKVMNVPFSHGHGLPSHPPGVSGGGLLQQRRGQLEARNIQLQTLQAFNDRRRGKR